MPKITLENTAAKGANLAIRVGQFDDNKALDKLKQIQANLGTKGTSGSLRIIYTTKSNKNLQFETRNTKWWGGLYTPSAERQEKNKTALRELFNKAGKDLSPAAKQEFEAELDNFFQANAKGIKNLTPLIQRFEEISSADRQPRLIGENRIGENLLQEEFAGPQSDHSVEVQQEIQNPVPQENLDSSLKSQIVEEKHDQSQAPVQEENDISVKSFIPQQQPEVQEYQEQPIKGNAHTSLKSQIEEDPEALEQPDAGDHSLSEKMDDPKSPRLSSFIDQENQFENEQPVSFHSNIAGDQGVDQSEYFFQQADEVNEGFDGYRESIPYENPINFQHQSVEFQENDPQPNIDVEGLRLKAADKLKEIQSSTLPKEIDALAQKVSDFQNDRKNQLNGLRERATEIQGRFDNKESLPSISDYLRDLEQLNADIKEFSKVEIDPSNRDLIRVFREKIESARDTLRPFTPKGMFSDDIYKIFPELENMQMLLNELLEIEYLLDESYSINEQPLNDDGIRSIYQGALDEFNGAEEELSSLPNPQQLSESLDRLENDIKDLESFDPYISYDSEEFSKDRKQLDKIYSQLEELNELRKASDHQLGLLFENLSQNHEIYQDSLGEDCPDFEGLLHDTNAALSETRAAGERLDGLLDRKDQILSRLQTVYKDSVALKEKYDKELQAEESEQKKQNLAAEQSQKATAAKLERLSKMEANLESALQQSEKFISSKSADAFQQIQERFPKTFDRMIPYVESVNKQATQAIPERLIEHLKKGLNSNLDKQITENGPVNAETRQKWKAEIDSKVKEWSKRGFYSEDQKQALQKLIAGSWGEQIKTEADGVISKFEKQKQSLQNIVAVHGQEFSIEQQNLRLEVDELTKQVDELKDQFDAKLQNLEALKKGNSLEDVSLSGKISDIQEQIIDLETDLNNTSKTLQEKKEQLAKTFSSRDTDAGRAIMQLDEKIKLIKESVNKIGIEFP